MGGIGSLHRNFSMLTNMKKDIFWEEMEKTPLRNVSSKLPTKFDQDPTTRSLLKIGGKGELSSNFFKVPKYGKVNFLRGKL